MALLKNILYLLYENKTFLVILFALVFGVGILSCDDSNNEKTTECFVLNGESLIKENQTIKGAIVYSETYTEYVIQNEKGIKYLVCPLLEEEFRKEDLEVEVFGDIWGGIVREPALNIRLEATYRVKSYQIKKK